MHPKALGFAEPCERCIRQLWEGLAQWCRTHCPTSDLDCTSVLQAHGQLQSISGRKDGAGAEGWSSYHVCRICGSRWHLFHWYVVGYMEIKQESADGRYYSSGPYVDGKKHGAHGYVRHWQGNERHSSAVFSESWDSGRLVEWQEYGPSVLDAEGNHRSFLVRSWAEEGRYRPLSLELTVLWDRERVGRIGRIERHVLGSVLVGTFFPDLNCDAQAPLFAQMRCLLDSLDETAAQDGADPFPAIWYNQMRQEIVEHVRFPELPIDLDELRFTGDRVRIRPRVWNLRAYAHRHPPRCIQELNPIPLERDLSSLIQHDLTAYFQVNCPCGQRSGYLLGHSREAEGPAAANSFVGPLALECPTCGRVSELIDGQQHGDDGAHGGDRRTSAGPRGRFPCPECGPVPLALLPGFSYDFHYYDPFDVDARPEDKFAWFSLGGDCSGCGKRVKITDLRTKRRP